MRKRRLSCAYQRNAPNRGAGNKVEFGLAELNALERQHSPEVQFASAPVSNPTVIKKATNETRFKVTAQIITYSDRYENPTYATP